MGPLLTPPYAGVFFFLVFSRFFFALSSGGSLRWFPGFLKEKTKEASGQKTMEVLGEKNKTKHGAALLKEKQHTNVKSFA